MEKKYYPTIGLEIHAELKTKTKMFCSCKNDPDEENPNVNICPVCMAHPGALPVINKQAVENVIKVGLALGSTNNIADFTEFDRKNYFYPDIPKGYQISQYKYPIVSGGSLAGMDVTRIHLEEDTANNKHDRGDFSLIDFNRAGVPLMELVTEAHTFQSTDEASKAASNFAKEYQLVLWYLGVSEANMEKGEMRVEANISVSADPKNWGTKVEVKNLNSFKSVEKAIRYELERMTELLKQDKESEIVQETRGWDEDKQKTFSQRKKEGSSDYRYFPDPDLPKLKLHEAFDLKKMKSELPELPEQKRKMLGATGASSEAVEIFVADKDLSNLYRSATGPAGPAGYSTEDIKKNTVMSNLITSSIIGIKKNNKEANFPDPEQFANLSEIIVQGGINSTSAKVVLNELMTSERKNVGEIMREKNLLQNNDEGSIKPIVEKVVSENPEVVATYKSGKENAIMSLVGKVIKESGGSANPQMVIEMLKNLLK